MLMLNRHSIDVINSMTKYPSIPTYHKLGKNGVLLPERSVDFGDNEVYLTEKLDGTNARCILLNHQSRWGFEPEGKEHAVNFLIGSREEMLHCVGDVIYNPQLDIVTTILGYDLDRRFSPGLRRENEYQISVRYERALSSWVNEVCNGQSGGVLVLFMEVYGSRIGKAGKNYAGNTDKRSFRLFDIACISEYDLVRHMDLPLEEAARWRDAGGQHFAPWSVLQHINLDQVANKGKVSGNDLPKTIAEADNFLHRRIDRSNCILDPSATGSAEGLIVRSADRKFIAKMRFEDYARTRRSDIGK